MTPSPLTNPRDLGSAAGTSRRQILRGGLAGCAGCLLGGCAGTGGSPDSAAGAAPDLNLGPIDAGTLADYPHDGIYESHADQGFFIVRRKGRLFAVSSICTHQHVLLDAGSNDFGCPRHGSVFSIDGVVRKAPAKSSLPHHPIRVNEQGRLIVDTSVDLPQKDWNAPAAYLAV